ncbi:MOSC domain-containing protein [Halomarina salina]|uniref:MOSC domain-containing protein n=1 Tax=Halomarina salina TaxID=1872699 RepID=A0ABD5RR99_9EURY|nr:MOSC domain-containing protein [Halomarina salina]
MSRVERLWTAPEDSAPMESHQSIRCLAGCGIEGDRYCLGTGYYSPYDVCQITFVESEALDHILEEYDIDLTDGRHRRNVVVRDVDVHDLLGQRFRVGDATFEGTRPRPPCAHVEAVADEEGVTRALTEGRGGICADVVEDGSVAVGDEVEVLGPVFDGEGLAESIRDRQG